MGAPELPVIYENPRFDQYTPTLKPVFDRALRFFLIMMIEWATLTLIEEAPQYLKVATGVLAACGLAVHESWPWLNLRGRWWYPSLMAGLLVAFVGVAGYAAITQPSRPQVVPVSKPVAAPAEPVAAPVQVDRRRNPLDSDDAKWRLVRSLHEVFVTRKVPACEISIVRYQLPYAENLSDDLKAVFKVLNWTAKESFATTQQPRGLSIRYAPTVAVGGNEQSQNCMQNFLNALGSAATWKGGSWNIGQQQFTQPPVCTNCIEIDIGNDPDAP